MIINLKLNRKKGKILSIIYLFVFSIFAVAASGTNQKNKIYKITMVLPREEQNIEQSFRQYLKSSGINIQFINIAYSGEAKDQPDLIARIRQQKPDLIYVWGTPTTLAVAGPFKKSADDNYIRDIPIVFTEVTDPVGAGLLLSKEIPNRNLTGVPHIAPINTQLGVLRSYRSFDRIGFIDNPLEPNSALIRNALSKAAKEKNLQVIIEKIPLDANNQLIATALPDLIVRIADKKANVLYIGPSTYLAYTNRDLVTNTAKKYHLPTFCTTESILRQSNCLFGIFSNGKNVGEFAGFKAEQILNNTKKVGEIPASPLQRFSVVINLPIAQELNFYPPIKLLQVADVIPINSTSNTNNTNLIILPKK